jgi:hypothetical protein
MAVDISSWPTKTEVCEILGLSLSQINNLVKLKRLEVRSQKRLGQPPIGRVNPQDVAREKGLRETREVQAHVLPTDAVIRLPAANLPAAHSRAIDVPAVRHSVLLASLPLWLRYDEAVLYSGLAESYLRELAAAGQVKTARGPRGSVVLNRADLEAHGSRRKE